MYQNVACHCRQIKFVPSGKASGGAFTQMHVWMSWIRVLETDET